MNLPYKSVTELCADYPNLAEYVGEMEGRLYLSENRNRLMNIAGNALYWSETDEKLRNDWVKARDWTP